MPNSRGAGSRIPRSLLELIERRPLGSGASPRHSLAKDCLARALVECSEFEHCPECTHVEQCLRIARGLAGHPLMGDH